MCYISVMDKNELTIKALKCIDLLADKYFESDKSLTDKEYKAYENAMKIISEHELKFVGIRKTIKMLKKLAKGETGE